MCAVFWNSTIQIIRWITRPLFLRLGISMKVSQNWRIPLFLVKAGKRWVAPSRFRNRDNFLLPISPVIRLWWYAVKTHNYALSITYADIMPRRWSRKRKVARSNFAVLIMAGLTGSTAH